jgi:hypothetical protein
VSRRRHSVEERAARFQRRYTGPLRTVNHEIGPVVVTTRYRRRRRIEWAEFDVAWHDLLIHALWRDAIVPVVRPIVRWFAARLP